METKWQIPKHTIKGLLSEQEAIDFLGLRDRPNPKGALRWLMRTRKVAHVKLGKGIYGFTEADLQACIESCRVSASGATAGKEKTKSAN